MKNNKPYDSFALPGSTTIAICYNEEVVKTFVGSSSMRQSIPKLVKIMNYVESQKLSTYELAQLKDLVDLASARER
jgi:hypothetical protein